MDGGLGTCSPPKWASVLRRLDPRGREDDRVARAAAARRRRVKGKNRKEQITNSNTGNGYFVLEIRKPTTKS